MDALVENIFNLSGLNLIIWSMYAGIILATLYSYYQKRIIGGFVQHMMKNGANSIDNAKTLEELGYHHHAAIRRSHSDGHRRERSALRQTAIGLFNRQAAKLADTVVEVVYSIPICVKGELPCV